MDNLKDLKDLLRHEVLDLCSAEDQIIEGMPAMIEKATHPNLKKALREHLRVTEGQRKRLDKVTSLLGEEPVEGNSDGGKIGGFFFGLFNSGSHKCKAMEGIIGEGNKMMGEDMNDEVMDAAIISCAQKIEHYEICGYGTAKAFARELQLRDVATLLNETLNEEYEADNILTAMAVGGGINEEAKEADAEMADGSAPSGARAASERSGKASSSAKSSGGKSASGKGSRASSNKASSSKSSTKGATGSSSKAASGKASTSKSSGNSKTSVSRVKGASAKTSPKGAAGRRLSPTSKTAATSSTRSSGAAKSGSKAATANKSGSKAASARGGSLGTSRSAGVKAGSKAAQGGANKSASSGKKSAGAKAGRLRRR